MAQASLPESILIADCGAVATKVGLVARVGNAYRLIGVTRTTTTVEPPIADVSVGVHRAIGQLESLLGRSLLHESGDLLKPEKNGAGVDAFAAVTSAALPLRGAVLGLSRDFSVASAQRALSATYVCVEQTIAVDEESGRWGASADNSRAGGPSTAVEKLALMRPDVIVMAGGVDGGPSTPLIEMANIVAGIGAAMEEGTRPLVIFAGNREVRAQIAERISGLMEFIAVDNVRPTLDIENLSPLQSELETIFFERRVKQIPGLTKLNLWLTQPILPTIQAYEMVAQFLAKRYGVRVLALDLGGAALAAVYADAQQTLRALAPEAGLGYGLDQWLTRVGLERVARWIPNSLAAEEAHAHLLNQALRPWTIPMIAEDRLALNAMAREAITSGLARLLGNQIQEVDLVLLSGAPVVHGNKPNALMLLALDALNLRGIFSVAADTTGFAPALGALATVNPEAAAQIVEGDALVTLGTALVPTFATYPGAGPVLQARIQTPNAGTFEVQVPSGSLELIPLGVGEKASVEIRPVLGVDLNFPMQSGVFKREMEGGTVGLVIDARGRPLPQAENLEQQRQRVQQWLWEVGA